MAKNNMNDPFSEDFLSLDLEPTQKSNSGQYDFLNDPELAALLNDEPAPAAEPKKRSAPVRVAPEDDEEEWYPPARKKKSPSRRPARANRSRSAGRVILIAALALILIAASGFGIFAIVQKASDPYGGRMAANVTVGGIQLGGMTKKEASAALKNAYGNSFSTNPMVVELPDTTLTFTPKDTGASLNVSAAVNAAYAAGRSNPEALDLVPFLNLKEDAIRNVLSDYASRYDGTYTAPSYTLIGEAPTFETENGEGETAQTLVLTRGTAGLALDMDSVFGQILLAYNENRFLVSAAGDAAVKEPEELDLQAVYDEICREPVEPYMDKTSYQPVHGTYGYRFDMDTAQQLLSKAAYGESVKLPMEFVPTVVQGEDVYFMDTLGFAVTPHNNNEKRNSNLVLACSKLNGYIIRPGETFSYNDVVGERSKENGWLPAPAYSGTELVDSPGGGVCQVSSTLFLASRYAEMEIIERVNHGFPVSYIPYGLDATVSYGTTDLKLRNDTQFPIKILAWEGNDHVQIKLMGTETRSYTVLMEFRSGGGYTNAYTVRIDPATGEDISCELCCRSSYMENLVSIRGRIAQGEVYKNFKNFVPDFLKDAQENT